MPLIHLLHCNMPDCCHHCRHVWGQFVWKRSFIIFLPVPEAFQHTWSICTWLERTASVIQDNKNHVDGTSWALHPFQHYVSDWTDSGQTFLICESRIYRRRTWCPFQRVGCCCTGWWSPPVDPSCSSSCWPPMESWWRTWTPPAAPPGRLYSEACRDMNRRGMDFKVLAEKTNKPWTQTRVLPY